MAKRRILGVGAGVIAAIGLFTIAILLAFAASGSGGGVVDRNAEGNGGEVTIAASTVTNSINYQGRLTDSAGNPLTGTYTMTFRLYNVSSGGTALDTDTHSVAVENGLFNTEIDFDQSYFDGRALWLGITVGIDSEMTPRQELRPVPYALSLKPGAYIVGASSVALHAESTQTSGSGIRGDATATSGTNYGVVGISKSPDGYGGYFYNNEGGTGVYGRGTPGGYFTTDQAGTSGNRNAGVNVSTAYDNSVGVRVKTQNDSSTGVHAITNGKYSAGVYARTTGYSSEGVFVQTWGKNSDGVRVQVTGDNSEGVHAYCSDSNAIYAGTGRSDHKYAFYTPDDNIYVGGKIDVVGTVDPIIVESFNADHAIDYEVGDVVCLDESGYVKPCSKADDTRVVGVVGPTVEIEEGEISVVIMGYRGAKPDEEHVEVMEKRLEMAEARVAEVMVKQSENVEEKENLGNEITMLRSEIEEAKSVTRQVVKVKVDASYDPIKIGELLTTSPTKGHAMKAQPVDIGGVEIYRPGTIIGKAIEPLESGTELIEVFVTLQ